MKELIAVILFLLSLLVISCSASSGNRYEKEKEETPEVKEKEKTASENYLENFDIAPYRAKIEIESINNIPPADLDIWFGFQNPEDTTSLKIIGQTEGYRVQVFITDNLDKADSLRNELYLVTSHHKVYISFDPPFYKIKMGDFSDISDAKNLSFKLSQLGYSKSRVANDQINLFK